MSDFSWGFGYGSNMNPEHLSERKGVNILEYTPAVLKDYKMAFNKKAFALVEPAYSGIEYEKGAEIHGLAYKITKQDMELLERSEGIGSVYNKMEVPLLAYDGRTLIGNMLTNVTKPDGEYQPSKRYLKLLVNGAKEVGLSDEYIKRLESTPTYATPDWVLEERKRHIPPNFDGLRPITVAELAGHRRDPDEYWTSVLGYVIKVCKGRYIMATQRGQDISGRGLLMIHDISLDRNPNQSAGRPPFPLTKDLLPFELEYIQMWFDQFMFDVDKDGNLKQVSTIIGYLKEWKEQQDLGTTDFKLPPKNAYIEMAYPGGRQPTFKH